MNRRRVRPEECAVVIVDMQNDFCHPAGALAQRGVEPAPPMDQVVPNLQALIDGAHDHGVPVVFVQTHHGPWTDAPTWIERVKTAATSVERVPVCAEGTWGADFFGVTPDPRDRVVIKHRYSAFIDTDLDVVLRTRGVKTLILTGIATNVCVESTGRDAFMKDYWVVTLADGTSANTAPEHAAGLFNMETYFGDVATTGDVLSVWAE